MTALNTYLTTLAAAIVLYKLGLSPWILAALFVWAGLTGGVGYLGVILCIMIAPMLLWWLLHELLYGLLRDDPTRGRGKPGGRAF